LVCWRNDRGAGRRVRRTVLAAVAGYAAAFAIMNWATSGELYRHTIAYQGQSGMSLASYGPQIQTLERLWPLVVLPVLALVLRRALDIFGVVTWVSVAWYLVASSKAGADVNYMLEPVALLCLMFGLLFTPDAPPLLAPRAVAAALRSRVGMAIALCACAATLIATRGAHLTLGRLLSPRGVASRVKVIEFLRDSPGDVLAEEPYFALAAGKPVLVSDPFQLSILARAGRFDFTPLARRLERGEIPRVVASRRLATAPDVGRALARWFVVVDRLYALDTNTDVLLLEYRGEVTR
jgi:hypothetical protein